MGGGRLGGANPLPGGIHDHAFHPAEGVRLRAGLDGAHLATLRVPHLAAHAPEGIRPRESGDR